MSTAVAKKKSAVKRPTANQSHKPTKADAERNKHLDFVKRMTGRHHHRWIKSNPSANLGDLLHHLEGVQEELEAFNDDDILAEIINELSDAYSYLLDFDPVDEPVDGDEELATVRYRLDNVEEDISDVEELIEAMGVSFQVKRLPKWKPRAKAV